MPAAARIRSFHRGCLEQCRESRTDALPCPLCRVKLPAGLTPAATVRAALGFGAVPAQLPTRCALCWSATGTAATASGHSASAVFARPGATCAAGASCRGGAHARTFGAGCGERWRRSSTHSTLRASGRVYERRTLATRASSALARRFTSGGPAEMHVFAAKVPCAREDTAARAPSSAGEVAYALLTAHAQRTGRCALYQACVALAANCRLLITAASRSTLKRQGSSCVSSNETGARTHIAYRRGRALGCQHQARINDDLGLARFSRLRQHL